MQFFFTIFNIKDDSKPSMNSENFTAENCTDTPNLNTNQESLDELSQQAWAELYPENPIDTQKQTDSDTADKAFNQLQVQDESQLANEIAWADQLDEENAKEEEETSKQDENKYEPEQSKVSTVASTLSVILQRCQSSIDDALAQQIDAAMLQELDDEEELMRDATIPDENETDENLDDEFMEEDDFVATEKALTQDVNSNSLAFERGLQRMRELNRRHVSNHYNNTGQNKGTDTGRL